HVPDIDKVHRRRAVAVYHRPRAAIDAVEPADENFSVGSCYIHARSINVEIAQAHTGQSVHVVEETGDPLVHQVGGTVEGTVVVGMMSLGGGEVFGCPVD